MTFSRVLFFSSGCCQVNNFSLLLLFPSTETIKLVLQPCGILKVWSLSFTETVSQGKVRLWSEQLNLKKYFHFIGQNRIRVAAVITQCYNQLVFTFFQLCNTIITKELEIKKKLGS